MSTDSTIQYLKEGEKAVQLNPFRSRSTVICLACLGTLIAIDELAMISGYFNVEFASLSIFVLREMIAQVFGHQLKSDETKNQTTAPSKP
jgi:hypothetical protein